MGIRDIRVSKGGGGELILTGETTNPHISEAIIKALSNQGNKLVDSIIILPDTLTNKNLQGWLPLALSISESFLITELKWFPRMSWGLL